MDLPEFDRHEVTVSTDTNGYLLVLASHNERKEEDGYVTRS